MVNGYVSWQEPVVIDATSISKSKLTKEYFNSVYNLDKPVLANTKVAIGDDAVLYDSITHFERFESEREKQLIHPVNLPGVKMFVVISYSNELGVFYTVKEADWV